MISTACLARTAASPTGNRSNVRRGPRAFGFSYIEVVVTIAVIGVLVTGVARTVAIVTQQQRASQRRLAAMQEAANLMERLMARPYDELSPEQASAIMLSDSIRRALPGASLSVDVSRALHDSAAKRLTVEIRWQSGAGQVVKPIHLVAWKYAPRGETP